MELLQSDELPPQPATVAVLCDHPLTAVAVGAALQQSSVQHYRGVLGVQAPQPGEVGLFVASNGKLSDAATAHLVSWRANYGIAVVVSTAACEDLEAQRKLCGVCKAAGADDVLYLEQMPGLAGVLDLLANRPVVSAEAVRGPLSAVLATVSPMSTLLATQTLSECGSLKSALRETDIPDAAENILMKSRAGRGGFHTGNLVFVDADTPPGEEAREALRGSGVMVVGLTAAAAGDRAAVEMACSNLRGLAYDVVPVYLLRPWLLKLAVARELLSRGVAPQRNQSEAPQQTAEDNLSADATFNCETGLAELCLEQTQSKKRKKGGVLEWTVELSDMLTRLYHEFESSGAKKINAEIAKNMNEDGRVQQLLAEMGIEEVTRAHVSAKRQNLRLGLEKLRRRA